MLSLSLSLSISLPLSRSITLSLSFSLKLLLARSLARSLIISDDQSVGPQPDFEVQGSVIKGFGPGTISGLRVQGSVIRGTTSVQYTSFDVPPPLSITLEPRDE